MIIARRASIAFGTDPTSQSVRSTISASARLVAGRTAEASVGTGLDLVRLYPALFAAQPQPSMTAGSGRAMSGALSAAVTAVAAAVAVFGR